MILQKNKLTIRQLEESDVPLLAKWLSNPKVLQYYEGRDNPFNSEKVKSIFFTKDPSILMCIVVYENIEIGYIQFYKLDDESKIEYGYDNTSEVICGMDQFIGEIDYWNRGIGSLLVSSMVNFLVNNQNAKKVVVDPQTWNVRAIKCYEKCGFKKIRLLPKHELHEGEYRDCYVMEYDSNC
ncbi:GNAT family N-acetyltransferase [Gottfriedia acidiceleris]|uniref:GNAT family N-acetyltransferase n=1 Tax=Gottfriedia acidiceleris TaxID=371036 RepID=UPI003D1C8131